MIRIALLRRRLISEWPENAYMCYAGMVGGGRTTIIKNRHTTDQLHLQQVHYSIGYGHLPHRISITRKCATRAYVTHLKCKVGQLPYRRTVVPMSDFLAKTRTFFQM